MIPRKMKPKTDDSTTMVENLVRTNIRSSSSSSSNASPLNMNHQVHASNHTTTAAAATTRTRTTGTVVLVAPSLLRKRLFLIRRLRRCPVLFQIFLLLTTVVCSLAVMVSVIRAEPSLSVAVPLAARTRPHPYLDETTVDSSSHSSAPPPFCQVTSHPMTMFMDGFHRSFFLFQHHHHCHHHLLCLSIRPSNDTTIVECVCRT